MNGRSYLTRTLSLLLCVVMLFGLLPVSAFATQSTLVDAAIFCSDVHNDSAENKGLAAVESVFAAAAQESGLTYTTAGFVGDTFNDYAGTMASVTEAAQTGTGNAALQGYYSYGSHDSESDVPEKTGLLYGGEDTNYYIYAIKHEDMSSTSPSTDDFTSAVAAMDKTKPLFIMSHLPLHDRRGDNKGAFTWYTAISTAAEEMDIVFLWAHNHTDEEDADIAAYYIAKDGSEELNVYNGDSVVPNFTYMNAGYLNPTNTPARTGVATSVAIYDDSLVFTVYDANGVYSGTGRMENETVVREFAATEPAVTLIGLDVDSTTAYTVGDELTFTKIWLSYEKEGDETIYGEELTKDDCSVTVKNYTTGVELAEAEAMATPGEYQAEITCTKDGQSRSTTELFTVCKADEITSDAGVTVSVSSAIIAAATVEDSANTNVAAAMGQLGVETYKAYDITPSSDSPGLKAGNYAKVTVPAADMSNPAVYYVSDDGATVEEMAVTVNSDGTVTFVTSHFSTWVVADAPAATEDETGVVENYTSAAEVEEQTVYVLTDTLTVGNDYLIANGNSGSVTLLGRSDDSVATITAEVKTSGGYTYIETADSGYVWNATAHPDSSYSSYPRLINDTYALYPQNGTLTVGTADVTKGAAYTRYWTYSDNQLAAISTQGSTTYYLNYSDSEFSTSSTASTIYIYEKQTIGADTVSGTLSLDAGDDQTVVVDTAEGATNTVTITPTASVEASDGTVTAVTIPEDAVYTYAVISDPNSILTTATVTDGVFTLNAVEGTATVRVYVTWDMDGDGTMEEGEKIWDTVKITTTLPYYEIDITEEDGTSITETIAIKGETAIAAGYSLYYAVSLVDAAGSTDFTPEEGSISWKSSEESRATVDANGKVTFVGEGTVLIAVTYTDPNGEQQSDTVTFLVTKSTLTAEDIPEYPNDGAVRFDKTASAVGNFSETGLALVELSMTGVPYSEGNELDVVLLLDWTGSMDNTVGSSGDTRKTATVAATIAFIKSIVLNEDGTLNSNRILIYVFESNAVGWLNLTGITTEGYQTITKDLIESYTGDTTEEKLENFLKAKITTTTLESAKTSDNSTYQGSFGGSTGGTYYSDPLYVAREAQKALKTTDRAQYCVFMSDGAPTDNYYTDTSTYYDASTVRTWVKAGTSGWDTSAVKAEYYSTLMKADGVTVFSVGLGVDSVSGVSKYDGENDGDGNTLTDASYEALTTAILTSIASPATAEMKTVYTVTDDDAGTGAMETAFADIAMSITEAATDVVVADKIGSNYTVNFSLPSGVDPTATDGLSEFYIQVVSYTLDDDNNRTGDPTVKENFTFNADGSLKSHTVGGVACGDTCSHVTTTDGVITKIEGTYFTYESTADGEYLTWEADKLDRNELALQYFVYLENSAGVDEADQIPADTYYTNEYATLTYTNHLGNRVTQEFPIPQMTWNGAQVSYTFYLVNDDGQPVNRAGRVIPFAEAIYVTDVYTTEIVWNDLEQSAGLEAEHLAAELVPEVYALYDDDASYKIHVYEDEKEVNLNNHFVICGDVTDDYNATTNSWTNPDTTYVFNNKSDATKYYTVGAYIANEGGTYLCKGDGTVTATIGEATGVTEATFPDSAYYTQDSDGNYIRALLYDASATYYTITSASYTAVDGETQATEAMMDSTTGAVILDDHAYYIDESNQVYTIVQKSDGIEVDDGFDFHNTTVAFAVVWKPRLETDTVVIDYGLDVVIDVAQNDNLSSTVKGVRTDAPDADINAGAYSASDLTTSVDVAVSGIKVGTASVEPDGKSVRFSLDKDNSMQLNDAAVFYYESNVIYYDTDNELKDTYMYSSVIVIPASTVYYEDDYVELTTETKDGETWTTDEQSAWTTDGTTLSKTQDVDRPGEDLISADYDANNLYGYDSAYTEMSKYSLGSAAKVNVKSGYRAKASFTFYGTGFDIISLTDTTTGAITVTVYDVNDYPVKTFAVDNYYGYAYSATEGWHTVTTNDPNALYQVPVMKVSDLTYGQYRVEILAAYASLFDHNDEGNYNFYLDAVRIYDPVPAGTVVGKDGEDEGAADITIEQIYAADKEGWPTYTELRNNVIDASGYQEDENGNIIDDGVELTGAIFIDSNAATKVIADYVSYGPNNELYLAPGQAIAFKVDLTDTTIADVQLGIKSADGKAVSYTIGTDTYEVKTATDMYYSILAYAQAGTVVIQNAEDSEGVLSLTNIKVTHTAETATTANVLDEMTAEDAGAVLMMLRSAPAAEETEPEETEPEETEPEETEPEETEPEETEPEETEPEETEPEETVPEETEPEETVPEETEPEPTKPGKNEKPDKGNKPDKDARDEAAEKIERAVKWLIGWLFG